MVSRSTVNSRSRNNKKEGSDDGGNRRERRRVLSESLLGAARELGLTQTQLHQISKISKSKLSRIKSGEESSYIEPGSGEGEIAVCIINLYRYLNSLVANDTEMMQKWLVSYNHDFGSTPIERMMTIEGLFNVTQYLDSFRGQQAS